MGFSLKSLAKACIDAETGYAIENISIKPRFILKVRGKRSEEKVFVLSGLEGRDLFGDHITYTKVENKTLVLVRCSNVRDFFSQGGWTPEDFMDDPKQILH